MIRSIPRCAAAWCLLHGAWPSPAEIIDRIAISVGNQVITESQIDQDIRLTAFLNRASLNLDPAEKKEAARRLVEQALIRREMELSRYPLPTMSDADESMKTIRSRYSSENDFRAALDSYGIDEALLKRRLWWQLTFLRFIEYRFRPGIQVSDADIQRYYQQELERRKGAGGAPAPSLDEMRSSIEQTLTEERIDQDLDRWLADARTQVPIRYHDEALR